MWMLGKEEESSGTRYKKVDRLVVRPKTPDMQQVGASWKPVQLLSLVGDAERRYTLTRSS